MDVLWTKTYLTLTGKRERWRLRIGSPEDAAGNDGRLRAKKRQKMERPDHAVLVEHPRAYAPTRIASILFVGALHIALIYALATGLAARLVTQLPKEITAQVIEPPQPKQEPPPVDVNLAQPTLPSVQAPQINIQQPPVAHTITTMVAPPAPPPVAPPVTTVLPPAPTPPSGIASTHTIPPYPDQSRRLGEQGTVRLRIEVAEDGTVSDASVVQSSGSSTLDDAAVAWVKDHWRYKPATQEGHAVSASVQAAVVFNIKKAG